MKVNPVVVYTGLISFIVGLICGGILIGSPTDAYAAVLVGIIGLIVIYTLYLWRIGGKS